MKPLQILIPATLLLLLIACGGQKNNAPEEEIVPKATVTTTRLVKGAIEDLLVVNGKTVFLKKNQIAAPISGYISSVKIKYGDRVKAGELLFELETRENKALQQSGLKTSTSGKVQVTATTSGIVNEPVTLGATAYVVEGTVLCSIANAADLLIQGYVPYENNGIVKVGMKCSLFLPDHSTMEGKVFQLRPFVDELSQTQEVLIKPVGSRLLPENLNLTASFVKAQNPDALLIPKDALLCNETQDEFWVMKMANDSLAVQVPVQVGIRNDSLVEVSSEKLMENDQIILDGGYALPDSSLVRILK